MQQSRVLVLDYGPEALIAVEHALENAGISATTTWHVAEAVRFLKEKCFDVVLVRRHAQIDSNALYEHCRQRPGCVVIAVDSFFDHEDILHLIVGNQSRRQSVPRRLRRPA